ncbi:hypothetical protein ACF5W4_07885 [Bacillota bacterium Lsc_1132]
MLSSFYDKLPLETLAQFFYYINRNIEQGILSKAMYYEMELIKKSARKHGLSVEDLNQFLEDLSNHRKLEISIIDRL